MKCALLNILGIRENSKVTFYLFGFVCYILGITIVLGFYDMDSMQARVVVSSITITSGKLFSGVDNAVMGPVLPPQRRHAHPQ